MSGRSRSTERGNWSGSRSPGHQVFIRNVLTLEQLTQFPELGQYTLDARRSE